MNSLILSVETTLSAVEFAVIQQITVNSNSFMDDNILNKTKQKGKRQVRHYSSIDINMKAFPLSQTPSSFLSSIYTLTRHFITYYT